VLYNSATWSKDQRTNRRLIVLRTHRFFEPAMLNRILPMRMLSERLFRKRFRLGSMVGIEVWPALDEFRSAER